MNTSKLNIITFDSYNEKWVDFVFANRNYRKPPYAHDYDIVMGPIANDNVGE